MRIALLHFILFSLLTGSYAQAQHYQRTISEITSCRTLSCIQSIRSKHNSMKKATPLTRSMSQGAERFLLDFDIPQEGKEKGGVKSFRLSLLVKNDSIYYGHLEQWEGRRHETTYLFINQHSMLKEHVTSYNQAHKANNSYRDLLRSIISREPIFWMWLD